MDFHSFSSSSFALGLLFPLVLLFSCSLVFIEASTDDGFTVDLIHRDSPESPLYNPSHSLYERIKRTYHRSTKRKIFFASTGMVPNEGEYLMEISFGTPPFKTFAIADSGSDLAWTQCKPCTHCFKEKFPIFNPKNSSSYKSLPCTSKTCHAFNGFCNKNGLCEYDQLYGDMSRSYGDLASETITFGSKGKRASFSNFVFGCGHNNSGVFPQKSSGIVGLGFGEQSIVSQLNSSINGKFSYCLGLFTEESKSGKLSFGKKALVLGHGVVTTPLILDNYYYLILQGISVGNKRLNYSYISPLHKPLKGNIIIDSGTTATYLPDDLYAELESTVKSEIKSTKDVKDPLGFFKLCYESLHDGNVPIITLHFKGADLKLNSSNTFVKTSDTVKCLGFASAGSARSIPIFGNIAQNNFWVGYDLENKVVSFKPSDCTKH